MSLHTNSDYEIISNAEVSSVISKYSPDMIDMSLDEILKRKNAPSISPMANIIESYETNLKIDMAAYPQFQNDMLERRTELYTHIMDKICDAHGLSYTLPYNVDIYTVANYMYHFLVSGYYRSCISFFANFLTREAKSISAMVNKPINLNGNTTHSYIVNRYENKTKDDSIAIIHLNLHEVLKTIHTLDIPLASIIQLAWANSPLAEMANMLSTILTDKFNFYHIYLSTIDANMAEAITDIRLQLLPIGGSIKDYLEKENE